MASEQRLAVFAVMLAAAAAPAAAQVPLGSEFRVDRSGSVSWFFPTQNSRSAAAAQDGTFIVTWVRSNLTGSAYDVMGRIVDANGEPRFSELRMNSYTTGVQENDSVAMDAVGNFIVVWSSIPGGSEVRGRIGYGGGEFPVGTSRSQPAVAAASDGKFVVVWSASDGNGTGVFARRFEANGTPAGAEFRVNADTTGSQGSPSVDADAAGNFVVVWTAASSVPGSDPNVTGQLFTASGVRQGADFAVSAIPTGDQYRPRVSRAGTGPFVVVWEERGANPGVAARRFDGGGAPVGAEFRASAYTTGLPRQPDVDMDQDGDFVIAWTSQYQDGSGDGVFAKSFSAAGGAGPEFRVNTYTTSNQSIPRIALDPAGNFIVGWHSFQNGESTLQAQRFAGGLSAAALAVDTSASPTSDGNGVLDPGESVTVAPSWMNAGLAAATFSGTAAFDGPPMPGAVYSVPDGAAVYGTVASGATGTCLTTGNCYAVGVTVPAPRTTQHWDARLVETMSPAGLGVYKTWTVHIGDSFADVPRSSSFYRFVETLLHRSVTGGCTATTYCPAAQATREQMAVFVLVAKEGASYIPPACATPMFADVPASSPFCSWIEELARRGVVGGCSAGNYCPTAPVSREQMAVFVLRTKEPGVTPPGCTTPMFGDVPAASPYCRWIEELARRGVVTGCGGGNYCPASDVSREQMSVFLAVTFGLVLYGI